MQNITSKCNYYQTSKTAFLQKIQSLVVGVIFQKKSGHKSNYPTFRINDTGTNVLTVLTAKRFEA